MDRSVAVKERERMAGIKAGSAAAAAAAVIARHRCIGDAGDNLYEYFDTCTQ